MKTERYCAYNQTRQRFVAAEVEATDGAAGGADLRLLEWGPGDGTALWIAPFRRISTSSARFPIDLVYLDENYIVLDTVEFFPMNVAGTASEQATSVLVLAADTLAQAQVKSGDQLVISEPKQMMRYLERLQNGGAQGAELAVPEVITNAAADAAQDAGIEAMIARAGFPMQPAEPIQETAAESEKKPEPVEVQPQLPFEPEPAVAELNHAAVISAAAAELAARNTPAVVPIDRGNGALPKWAAELREKRNPLIAPGDHSEDAAAQSGAELNGRSAGTVLPIDRSNGAPSKTPTTSPEKKDAPPERLTQLTGQTVPADAPIEHRIEAPAAAAEPAAKQEPGKRDQVAAHAPVETAPLTEPKAPASTRPKTWPPDTAAMPPRVNRPATAPVVQPNGAPKRPGDAQPRRQPAAATGRPAWPSTKEDAPKSWLERLLYVEEVEYVQDARRSPRESLSGLVAYFFTGGTPTQHPVRDISLLGLYIVTKVRWYHGTIVQLTLTDDRQSTMDRSITLFGKVVRTGSDGVGMKFILEGDESRRSSVFERYAPTNGIDLVKVARFIRNFTAPQRQANDPENDASRPEV
jgi:hypothetical protein